MRSGNSMRFLFSYLENCCLKRTLISLNCICVGFSTVDLKYEFFYEKKTNLFLSVKKTMVNDRWFMERREEGLFALEYCPTYVVKFFPSRRFFQKRPWFIMQCICLSIICVKPCHLSVNMLLPDLHYFNKKSKCPHIYCYE